MKLLYALQFTYRYVDDTFLRVLLCVQADEHSTILAITIAKVCCNVTPVIYLADSAVA